MMLPKDRSATEPARSTSRKAELQRRVAALLDGVETTAGWTPSGFRPDLDLLGRVLALTNPQDTRVGSVAVGLDMWAAAMLRAAGLGHVQPHAAEPFYVGRAAPQTFRSFQDIDGAVADIEARLERLAPGLARADVQALRVSLRKLTTRLRETRKTIEQSTTSVLGEGRRKQVDVFLADWDRGLELLISTKTFALAAAPNELAKNLSNRWEEFDGDLKNLRGRFPLAVIGALTMVSASTVRGPLYAFVDMMTKLTAPGRPWVNGYDQTAIVVAEDWAFGTSENVRILNTSLDPQQLPPELQPAIFFNALIERLLERSPISEHAEARRRRAVATGQDPASITSAVEVQRAAEDLDEDDPAT